jgi:cell wall-associated NlpC family hydrolase
VRLPQLTAEQKAAMVLAARALVTANNGAAVPFRHQGRTLRGMDCIGALVWAVRAAGLEVDDRTDYGHMPSASRKLAQSLTEHFGEPVLRRAKPEDLQVGDLLAMAWGVAGDAHVGIVGDHKHGVSIIHSHANAKFVVEQRIDALIAARITGVWRP